MDESIQVAAFEGGKLRILRHGEKSDEAVLALPLKRLLVRMVRIPIENRETATEYVTPIIAALSPYPDEELTVSCETVRDSAEGMTVLAAALPESSTEDIGIALDESKLSITRVDATVLGALRMLWTRINDGRSNIRRLVAFDDDGAVALVVLDDDMPSAIRAVSDTADLGRETMLSLLEAEEFGGAKPLAEIVVVGDMGIEAFERIAPVRRIDLDASDKDMALEGVMDRAGDPTALNALPASWREQLDEKRFKHKLFGALAVAGGIWLLVMAVLFGVPVGYGFMTDHQKSLSKAQSRQYNQVKTMKAKVDLVKRYSDHARGALEMMRLVSDSLPLPDGEDSDCITLGSFSYDRGFGLRLSGEAKTSSLILDFDDRLAERGDIFAEAPLNGPSKAKDRFRFSIDCPFIEDGEVAE